MCDFQYQIVDTQKDGEVVAMFKQQEDRDDFWGAYDEMYGTEGLEKHDRC